MIIFHDFWQVEIDCCFADFGQVQTITAKFLRRNWMPAEQLTGLLIHANGTESIKFKAQDSEIVATPLCLGNISKGFSIDNMKKTGLYEYVYDTIAVNDILHIHKYLMKKNNMI